MTRWMLVFSLVLASAPAEACHRFHVWNYPWPQRCGVLPKIVHPPNNVWYVEITKMPPPSAAEMDGRAQAVERLKAMMPGPMQ